MLGMWGRGSTGMLWAGLAPVRPVWLYEHPVHPRSHPRGVRSSPALCCRVRSPQHYFQFPQPSLVSRGV